jgi:hypothetical protein
MRVAIIGSGPSGWSATQTLIKLGHEVTVVDAGLVESDPKYDLSAKVDSTLNRKLYFGSDLPYRSFPFGPTSNSVKVNPIFSFARGGLSLVWGATMLPYSKEDTEDWPFDISTLENEFRILSEEIPITGVTDPLSAAYGDFYSRRGILISKRVLKFLENCNESMDPEVIVGLSRLAVETGKPEGRGCIYCNKCISGCPFNYIWSSKEPIDGAKYLKLRVTNLTENSVGVSIEGTDITGKSQSLNSFEKVFLACGSLESFRILANSKIVGRAGVLKDSATFFVPMLVLPKIRSKLENSFGLSQLFIRLNKNQAHSASQFQVYEYSEDLIARAKKAIPLGGLIPNTILRFFLKRMMVAIGYLDGKDSPKIQMNYLENGGVFNQLETFEESEVNHKRKIRLSVKRLSKFSLKHGLLPLPFLTQIALPGEGVHFGSWLPMGEKSDLLGRPSGSQNIHVVDSSVLPSIAPGPITFTVMANAARIAREAVQ